MDAANRLVAASLESRWNESLQRLDEVRRQFTDFQRQQTRTFTPEQREQILALARDLPRLWQAETTSAKDRKRLLRLLLQDITVERDPGRQVILHVRWFGGACEDLHVTLPAKIQDRLRYEDKPRDFMSHELSDPEECGLSEDEQEEIRRVLQQMADLPETEQRKMQRDHLTGA